jgi:hypothetical protein
MRRAGFQVMRNPPSYWYCVEFAMFYGASTPDQRHTHIQWWRVVLAHPINCGVPLLSYMYIEFDYLFKSNRYKKEKPFLKIEGEWDGILTATDRSGVSRDSRASYFV